MDAPEGPKGIDGPWEIRKGFFTDESGVNHESKWWYIRGKPGEHTCHIDCLTKPEAIVVRELVAGKGFLLSDRGETELRGFEDPVRVYEVRWREE